MDLVRRPIQHVAKSHLLVENQEHRGASTFLLLLPTGHLDLHYRSLTIVNDNRCVLASVLFSVAVGLWALTRGQLIDIVNGLPARRAGLHSSCQLRVRGHAKSDM